MKQVKVLFVCTGNICRSPTAEGVFRHLVADAGLADTIVTDSAGTHGYHVGEPPDERSVAAAQSRGFEIGDLRARRVRQSDFEEFDLILAMDQGHYDQLAAMAPPEARDRVQLFMDYAPEAPRREVPDPYYGQGTHFTEVLDLVEVASSGLLDKLRHSRPGAVHARSSVT
ncbi:low molecular weight protein-tyrosine-phosphatase [Skermanella stibiiresistens]|uniref:low molecular weight protein-tyrosine-phosphatase n=1 Tax=Skermanella stibiiresistens TaxID=913326 RepID=UPI0004BBC179|nr:low molecular weight protein-tyrosine-phosphatase [Skermanella stibiiresistens]